MQILSGNHWAYKNYKQRITRGELKKILLNNEDTAIIRGRFCCLKRKSLGAGVYEVWFEGG
jgi:hypothetical protein